MPAFGGIACDEQVSPPLPSDQALTVHRFADEVRMVRVRERSFWPTEHRQAFYVAAVER